MKNIPLLIGTIVGTLVLIIAVAMFSSNGSKPEQANQVVDSAMVAGEMRHLFKTNVDKEKSASDSAEGKEEKLVTIVEFSDFQCPACKAALPTVKRVKEAYAGKIQFVYRHFPLDQIHPNARLAALASEAVTSLDDTQFWAFHDKLFAEQANWAEIRSRDELKSKFADYATELGLDRDKFLEKMKDSSLSELVNSDVSTATKLGVNATPTFYVDGVKTSAPELMRTVESLMSN